MSELEEKLSSVRERIRAARARSAYGQEVALVAVTKFHPLHVIKEAVSLGITEVGENRVQELEEKRREGELPVRWNLIGHLQRNKVKKAVALSDLIQSGDSLEILEEIQKRAAALGKVQDVLLEVNVSGEESKHGLEPGRLSETAEAVKSFPNLCVRGLMCMAPHYEDPERTRPVFREAHALWESLASRFPEGQAAILSMGMTNDFEIAIEEGATMVRVGTALFGEREYD